MEYKIENDDIYQNQSLYIKIQKLFDESLKKHFKFRSDRKNYNLKHCEKFVIMPENFRDILIKNSEFKIKNNYMKYDQIDSRNLNFLKLLAYKCFFKCLKQSKSCYDCFYSLYFTEFFREKVLSQYKMIKRDNMHKITVYTFNKLKYIEKDVIEQKNKNLNKERNIFEFLFFPKEKYMVCGYYNPLFDNFFNENFDSDFDYKKLYASIKDNYHFGNNQVQEKVKIYEVYTKQEEITGILQFFDFMYPINYFLILSSTVLYFNDKYKNAIVKVKKNKKPEIKLYNNLNTDSKNIFICFDILFEKKNLFFQNQNSLLCDFFLKTYEKQKNYDIIDYVNNSTNNFKNLHIIFEVGGIGSAERLKSNLYFHYLSKKIFEKNKSLVLERYKKIYKKYRKGKKLNIFCHEILNSILHIGFVEKGHKNRFLIKFASEGESKKIYKEYAQKMMDILSDFNKSNNQTQCIKIERIYIESIKIYFDFLVEKEKYSDITNLFYYSEDFFNVENDEKNIFYVYLPFYENIESIFNFLNFKNYDFIYENVKITIKFDSGFFLYNQNKKPKTENCFHDQFFDFKNFYFTFDIKSFKDEILFNVKTILNYYIFLYENQIKDYDFGNLKEAFNNFLKDIKEFSSNGLSNVKLENEFIKSISQNNYKSLIKENNKLNNQNIITKPKTVIKSIQNVPLLLNNSDYVPTHNLVLNHQKGKKGKKPNPNLIEKKEKEKKRLKNK